MEGPRSKFSTAHSGLPPVLRDIERVAGADVGGAGVGGAGVGVYVTVNLLSEVRRGASRFHANYTRSQAKWHHFNTW